MSDQHSLFACPPPPPVHPPSDDNNNRHHKNDNKHENDDNINDNNNNNGILANDVDKQSAHAVPAEEDDNDDHHHHHHHRDSSSSSFRMSSALRSNFRTLKKRKFASSEHATAVAEQTQEMIQSELYRMQNAVAELEAYLEEGRRGGEEAAAKPTGVIPVDDDDDDDDNLEDCSCQINPLVEEEEQEEVKHDGKNNDFPAAKKTKSLRRDIQVWSSSTPPLKED